MTTPIFTPEEEAIYAAQQRGYTDLREYVRSLVAQDSDQAYFQSAEWHRLV